MEASLGQLPVNRKRKAVEDDLGEGRDHSVLSMALRAPKFKCFLKSSLFYGPRYIVRYCNSLPQVTDPLPKRLNLTFFRKFNELPKLRCNPGRPETLVATELVKHVQLVKRYFGLAPLPNMQWKETDMGFQYLTITRGLCVRPKSLHVNKGARDLTIDYYHESMGQSGSPFALPTVDSLLAYGLTATSTALDSRAGPAPPGFTKIPGPWSNDSINFPKDEYLEAGGVLLIPEFMTETFRRCLSAGWDEDWLDETESTYQRLLDWNNIEQPVYMEKTLVTGIVLASRYNTSSGSIISYQRVRELFILGRW
ncbi:hypothetical protein GGR53DRAFT_465891 [Hypoxylon sp. FL1150]|nr:hypothetical protein GGR53DRAFT_465891 [Hypoxylon sp. FL1150]